MPDLKAQFLSRKGCALHKYSPALSLWTGCFLLQRREDPDLLVLLEQEGKESHFLATYLSPKGAGARATVVCSLVGFNMYDEIGRPVSALGQNILEGGEWIERIAYWFLRKESR